MWARKYLGCWCGKDSVKQQVSNKVYDEFMAKWRNDLERNSAVTERK